MPLRRAWYGLIILASVLPALALSPWLSSQAHSLLLERSMLEEKIFHSEIETRLSLETKRLLSVLTNASDPMSLYFSGHQNMDYLNIIIDSIFMRESTTSIAIYNHHARFITGLKHREHSFSEIRTDMAEFSVPMHGRTFLGSPTKLADGDFEFVISLPIIVNRRVTAVLTATININQFWANIRAALPEHNSKIYLIDSRGSLLAHLSDTHHQQGELLSHKAIVRSLLAGNDWKRPEIYQGFNGDDVFGIASLVPALKWGIISEIPSSAIMNPIISALITLTIIVFLLHILFGLISLLFTKRLLSPISDLADVVKKATEGDYTRHARHSPYIEINALTTAFNVMIKEIKRRESSLKKLSQAVEQAAEAILITDHKGIIEYVNPAFTRITGYALDEAIGKTPAILSSGKQNREFYKKLWQTISKGNIWEGTLTDRKKSGELYPALMSIAPIKAGNKTSHYVSIQQDMTNQLLLEDQLRQSQKMEALGTLVGGIAHDFNNMLAGITGNLYLARKNAVGFPAIVDKIKKAEILGYQAGEMIAQLLAFARKSTVQMIPLPLTSFLNEAVKLAATSIPENITITTDISKEPPLSISGDSSQIQQILMNLINNAGDAVAEKHKPKIHISLKSYEATDAFRISHPHLESDWFALLTVHDNGHGISSDLLDNIFEPFFTTKLEGQKSGLGLSMVYGAMQTHGGVIDVESDLNSGTSFHLYFPLIEQEGRASQTIDGAVEKQGSGELILVVDDDPMVCEACREVLESLDYKVLVAADGIEGLKLFTTYQQEIALVLTDVVMPEMNGLEMAKAIRAINESIPFIFSTGYDKELFANKIPHKKDVLLTKPLSISKLSQSIQTLLKGG